MRSSLAVVVLALLIDSMLGCERTSSSKTEVQNVRSPNGRLEAVVYEINGGATTSFGYEVDVQEVGHDGTTRIADLYGAIRNEGAYGVNVKWSGTDLHIEYLRAKAVTKSVSEAEIGGQHIRVRLDAEVVDTLAPSGSMQSSLEKR